jgi:hypothetical protein
MLAQKSGRANIAAAGQIAQLVALCTTSARSQGDPNHCAIAAYHGSWERPDNGFADRVLATAAKGDGHFEMPEGTRNDTGEVNSTSRNTTPATAPSPTPDNDERARQSPLFPIMAKPADSSPGERPTTDRTAAGEEKNDAQIVPPTATPLHVDSAFAPRSVQQSASKSKKKLNLVGPGHKLPGRSFMRCRSGQVRWGTRKKVS